jgi:predicted TIM-barrel fold metal-dependent hydrolase
MAIKETSGQEQSRRSIKRLDDYTVVDADVHEIMPDVLKRGALEQYLEEPYKSRYRQIKRTDEPLAGTTGSTQPHDIDPTPHGLGDDVSPTSAEGLEGFMERFNSDYIVMHGHGATGANTQPDKEFAQALSSAYNDYMLDNILDEYEGFKSGIHIAPEAGDAAAEEIHRLADEDDMVSVYVMAAPNGLFGGKEFEPIYEAANEEGIPIDYHPSQSLMPWSGLWGGPNLYSTAEFMGVYGHHLISHIPSLIFNGIPEKYPNVDHVFLEQGLAWIPWAMGRMDKNYERRKHEFPHLERKPSEYLREHFFFGTQPMEDVAGPGFLAELFDMIGAEDMVMYSTDFPHFDFDYPAPQAIPRLDDDVERAIFSENAREVYGI